MPYQKGQSGNPLGRPKGNRNTMKGVLDEILNEKKWFRIPGSKEGETKVRKIEIKRAIAMKASELALKGDVQAMKFIAGYTDGIPKADWGLGGGGEAEENQIVQGLNKLLGEKSADNKDPNNPNNAKSKP